MDQNGGQRGYLKEQGTMYGSNKQTPGSASGKVRATQKRIKECTRQGNANANMRHTVKVFISGSYLKQDETSSSHFSPETFLLVQMNRSNSEA
jgi:hypothetical protein